MVESIAKTLGVGSGIDVGALVGSLIEAQFAAKTESLTKKSETLAAQISGIATLKNGITGFNAALKSLIAGGTLASKLTSSNPTALKVTAQAGADLSTIAQTVGVTQLASNQVSTTNTPVAADAAYRRGTLTLQFGTDVYTSGAVTGFTASGSPTEIDINAGDATLPGIAAAINAANAGVTASIVTDGAGVRLSIRGANGSTQAFQITTSNSGGGSGISLAGLAVSRTSTVTTTPTRAMDAIVTIDGVRFNRTSNTITDLVPGVTLDLQAVTTSPVAISMTRQPEALNTAVNDVVATFNEMLALTKAENDPVTGLLRGDTAVRTLARSLNALTTVPLITAASGPTTLADLGVTTARDGTLSVNAATLTRALRDHPAAVEAMFKDGAGLSSALNAVTLQVTDRNYGFDAATSRYTKLQTDIGKAQERIAAETEIARNRMTMQFASMDAKVAAYKSTQAFLTQQIDAWNSN